MGEVMTTDQIKEALKWAEHQKRWFDDEGDTGSVLVLETLISLAQETDLNACCSHLTVNFMPHLNNDGSFTERWECQNCRKPFTPYTRTPQWKTIDSAPRDGEYILAVRNEKGYSRKCPNVIQWDGDLSNWTDWSGNEVVYQPTHWNPITGLLLPLPAPPGVG